MLKASYQAVFTSRNVLVQLKTRGQLPRNFQLRLASQRQNLSTASRTRLQVSSTTWRAPHRGRVASTTSLLETRLPLSVIRSRTQLRLLATSPSSSYATSTTKSSGESKEKSAPGQAASSDASDENGPNMLAGVKSDMNVVKETFALRDVPREVLYFGLAGLVPYVVTSATTLFLAYDINNIQTVGRGFIFTQETASDLLNFLEPVQVGFGAVILSFLGAIHWGLEFAGFGGHAAYRRYFLGILAPALAWPTVLLPFDYALLTQFLGFTGMYFADAQATTKGWAPKWYTTYRFALTFIVGASIVITLVGRGKIGDQVVSYIPSPDRRASKLKTSQRVGFEQETNPKEFQAALKEGEKEAREAKEKKKEEEEEEGEEKSKEKDKGNETKADQKKGENEDKKEEKGDEKSKKDKDEKDDKDDKDDKVDDKVDKVDKDNSTGRDLKKADKDKSGKKPK